MDPFVHRFLTDGENAWVGYFWHVRPAKSAKAKYITDFTSMCNVLSIAFGGVRMGLKCFCTFIVQPVEWALPKGIIKTFSTALEPALEIAVAPGIEPEDPTLTTTSRRKFFHLCNS